MTRGIIIEPFKSIPGTAEIIGLGRLSQSAGSALEAEIEVLIAAGMDEPGFDPERDCHVRMVGCGQMDLLTIGSKWKLGKRASAEADRAFGGIVSPAGEEHLGAGALQPDDGLRIFPSGGIAATPCFLVRCNYGDRVQPSDPRWMIVPKIEVARALFGVSSQFILELIDGVRSRQASPDRGAFLRSGSRRISSDLIRIAASRRLTRHEAVVAALLITDQRIRQAHDLVFQALSLSGDWRGSRRTPFEMSWPFFEPLSMSFQGRWFQREGGEKRFLVTRILELDVPLGFSEIEVYHPGPSRGPADQRLPPPSARLRFDRGGSARLITGRASSWSRRPTSLPSESVSMTGAKAVRVRSIAAGGDARPPASGLGDEAGAVATLATADRQRGGDQGIGRAVVQRRSTLSEGGSDIARSAALLKTWEAVNAAADDAGWSVLPFPSRPLTGSKDAAFDFSADTLLAELETPTGFAILVDSGSTEDRRRSLGILVAGDGSNLTESAARRIREISRRADGQWRAAPLRGIMKRIGYVLSAHRRPPEVWSDEGAYANLVIRWVEAALKGDQRSTSR